MSAVLKVVCLKQLNTICTKSQEIWTKLGFDVHTRRLLIQDTAVMYCTLHRTQFSIQVVQSICYIMEKKTKIVLFMVYFKQRVFWWSLNKTLNANHVKNFAYTTRKERDTYQDDTDCSTFFTYKSMWFLLWWIIWKANNNNSYAVVRHCS